VGIATSERQGCERKPKKKNKLMFSAILFHYAKSVNFPQSQNAAFSTGIVYFPQ
jgi:hypothetical protein